MNPGEPLAEGHLLDGRYRVKKVLGVGGMGRVYLSNDTRLANRPVAVKEMVLGEGVAEKKAIEDFTREATVLARLSHPGIPTLIDHFAEKGRHYLVMEFVAGGDLDRVLESLPPGGRVPENQVVRWMRQLLEVLDFLHGQSPPIIYRDFKPGNVMIDKDGRAMLVDFGIARFLPRSGRATQIGSPGYAPPEQYVGKVEPRSDLYALAATIHHLLTGRDPRLEPPFSFPPVRDLAPEVSVETARAVDRALEHDLTKRFASAREMLRALPEPPPEASGERARSGAGSGRSLGTIDTVVLDQPVGSALSAAGSLLAAPRATPAEAGARPSSPTPRKLASAPRISDAPRGLSQMPTVVLNKPALSDGGGTLPPSRTSVQVRKAIELTGKARALIERGLKSRIASSILPPMAEEPSVSSTAKTQELKRPGAGFERAASPSSTSGRSSARTNPRAAASSPTAPKSRAPSKPALFPDRTESSEPAVTPARLIARAESVEFGLDCDRMVIGRSENSEDDLDIDLKALKQGAERVSRKHAEIIRRGADYFIRDLGSLNGTYIVGRGRLGRDQLYKLKDRDQLVMGGTILQFRKG
ncbi:MAG TPA: protein kinase [Candidatus Binataceae bacterium]|nr:protein kinase [Candidatus Binataceae bacterium]